MWLLVWHSIVSCSSSTQPDSQIPSEKTVGGGDDALNKFLSKQAQESISNLSVR